MTNDEIQKLTFEEAMRELEKLVDGLDKGDISLDEVASSLKWGVGEGSLTSSNGCSSRLFKRCCGRPSIPTKRYERNSVNV